jgi:hypothetical protein
MAATFSKHYAGEEAKPANKQSRIARCYGAIVAWMRGESSPQSVEALQPASLAPVAAPARPDYEDVEEHEFSQWRKRSGQIFSDEELIVLRNLRHAYQNGASDRAEIIRHLNFLKYLLSRDQISL